MGYVHRDKDSRSCGAQTIATGTNVRVNGRTVAVDGDKNTHGGGSLITSNPKIRIGGKPIIVLNDNASPDKLCPPLGGAHCSPKASTASGNVRAGG
jgi:uncharacterized Zn-binding protein involved in type VI secretion